jgi:acyl-coenzyme A thioesterase PaaI-like protein
MTEQVQPGALSSPIQEGPWRDWSICTVREPFEELVGPFYTRREIDGSYTTGFRPSERNLNSSGILHGGAIATFADYSLFMIACEAIHGRPSVTVTLNTELMGAGRAETLLMGRGEVLRTTNSLVFVRGIITSEGAPVVSFSGIIKLIRPEPPRE